MNSPISLLWPNIMHAFENADGSSLALQSDATKTGKVSREIQYDVRENRVKTPFAGLKSREINVQETHLCHLWSYIYSVFVIYEEAVQKRLENKTFNGFVQCDNELLERANKLFDWSMSLTKAHSSWDESLPNPRSHKNQHEKYYAEKVNGIFQDSVAFLLLHEFAHLHKGHDEFYLNVDTEKLTKADFAEWIQIENEADQYAFETLIKDSGSDRDRLAKGLAIVFLMCSALILTTEASGIKQRKHPDLDSRIVNTLAKLNLEEDKNIFYVNYLCVLSIRLYLLNHDIPVDFGVYETTQEALDALLDELDNIKKSK